MREAKLGDGLGDSQESDLYQDMYDQQLAAADVAGQGPRAGGHAGAAATRNSAAAPTAAAAAARAASLRGDAPRPARDRLHRRAAAAIQCAHRISFVQSLEPYAQRRRSQLGVSRRHSDRAGGARDRLGPARRLRAAAALEPQSVRRQGRRRLERRHAVNAPTTEYGGGQRQHGAAAVSRLQLGAAGRQRLCHAAARACAATARRSAPARTSRPLRTRLAARRLCHDPDYVQKLQATGARSVRRRLRVAASATDTQASGRPADNG